MDSFMAIFRGIKSLEDRILELEKFTKDLEYLIQHPIRTVHGPGNLEGHGDFGLDPMGKLETNEAEMEE